MRKSIGIFVLSLIFVVSATTPAHASNPPVNGAVAGKELCPQFICGAAIFAGGFQGQIGNLNTSGVITTALKHTDPLPVVKTDPPAVILGGVWEVRTLFQRVSGIAMPAGTIASNGDKTFHVNVVLKLTGSGQSGFLLFSGTLDHNPLIPSFFGTLTEIP